MNGAKLFIKCLENEGVEYIFGIPGEENLLFLDALRSSTIRLILTRHEQAAGFMAATYGRLTGKPGVCLSTLGPGATNFVTSAAYALLGGMPVLFITGQKPIKKSKQGRFQIVDIVRMMEPLTKFTRQIVNAGSIPSLVRDAFRLAEQEKPGPVHLELPEDIAAEKTTGEPFEVITTLLPRADRHTIEKVAELIQCARHPLLLIASGANRKKTCHALYEFLDKTGLFFFSTQMGKGVVDERHDRSIGTAALTDHDYIHCAINRADLIINVGHDIVEKPPFIMTKDSMQVIHIHYSNAQIDDVYFPQYEVIGDIAENLLALTSEIKPCNDQDTNYFFRIKNEIENHVYSCTESNAFPSTPQKIVSDIRNSMPDDGIISLDNGMYKIWFARNYKAYESNTVLLDNALATMGAGLPAAISAKLINPEIKVAAICGDGGFMMNSQELETAVRLNIDLVVVILKDNAYGMIKWKQSGFDLHNFGLDFGNPDFVKYAESYGAKGYRITKEKRLTEVLKECLNTSGVHVLEVPVDYSENEKVFFEELKQKTCVL
ncbi:MAG: acetolactate synthase large subunit [Desulfobacterales bacterium]|nr:acetolactate synthase large subunit [Desulfobacterales bacterium]MDX2509527.1 acetolactate synthase large subunit [Desulfobacterales bacterium]